MSSNDIAISIKNLSKCYEVYATPRDRLKQFVLPRLQRLMGGQQPRQYFSEFWALKDVSFEIRKGETVGIIGRNGSGKSTLLQLLCGTLTPTSGNITTNGKVAALLELGAGFNPEFTGRENVFLSASLYGLTNEQTAERFDQIVAFADIGQFIEQPVKTYSSGMFVRLAFAVITHVDADILVIDEALAVGDAYFVQKCMRYLRKFTQHGTLFFVSHDTSAVVALCSKVLLLDSGKIDRVGTPKDISEYYLALLHNEQRRTPATINTRNGYPASSNDFGAGLVKIISIDLHNEIGNSISCANGGEYLRLNVTLLAESEIKQIIVGFLVRDRLGQILFGENTSSYYGDEGLCIKKKQAAKVSFEFIMPFLRSGSYSISVATAQGTQIDHIQQHWIHDALIIHSHTDQIYSGIFFVPMNKVNFNMSCELIS
jgi:lipopolysaccharide transport system ATP-binding protein